LPPNYDKLLQSLAQHRIVLVTGPHRSGTTFVTAALADDLGFAYTTETAIREANGRFSVGAVRRLMLEAEQPFVIHGASCFKNLKHLQRDDLATVFVYRDINATIESQKRMQGRPLDQPERKQTEFEEWCRVKWIKHPFSVCYEQMMDHPLFHNDRQDWDWRQFRPDGETAEKPNGGIRIGEAANG